MEIIPNKSTVVTEIDRNKPEKWYLPMAHLHGLAANLPATICPSKTVLLWMALNEQMKARSIAGDVGGTLSADAQFHNLLLDIAGNEFIKEFSDTLITHIERFEFRFYSGCETFSPTTRVLEALRQRDAPLPSKQYGKTGSQPSPATGRTVRVKTVSGVFYIFFLTSLNEGVIIQPNKI